MAQCKAEFTFPATSMGGSPPYKTGFHFECASTADAEASLENLDIWWTAATAFRNLLYSLLGTPLLTVSGEFSGIVQEYEMEATDDPAGDAPTLPGCSLRAVKLGSRPLGGRRGSMYWPGIESTVVGVNGDLDPTAVSTAETALEGLRAIIEDIPGQYILTVHDIGGVASTTPVTGFDVKDTVSFLNRRYR